MRTETLGCASKLYINHIDLCEIGDLVTPKNTDRYRDFWTYSISPWKQARELNVVPDTILIDGRFRVACFLYSLLRARVGATIIFDDYFDRPHYFVVERFFNVEEKSGRAGVFRVSKHFNVSELVPEYVRYILDWS